MFLEILAENVDRDLTGFLDGGDLRLLLGGHAQSKSSRDVALGKLGTRQGFPVGNISRTSKTSTTHHAGHKKQIITKSYQKFLLINQMNPQ